MGLLQIISLILFFLVMLFIMRVAFSWWVLPARAYLKFKRSGFGGPTPSFPFGNIGEMKKKTNEKIISSPDSSSSLVGSNFEISHDIHSTVFPYFARWQKSHGKVFVYWLGTEPFLYVAEPEFLKRMSAGITGKTWGKPNVFKYDRKPLFGNGLVMLEGDDWVRHRHVITPAFSPSNLKAMTSLIVESTNKMLETWMSLINSGNPEIDVEKEITATAGEIIAKTSFGITHKTGREVFDKLRAMQMTLFKANRYVGVPFNKFINPKQTLKTRKLGEDVDNLLLSIISDRENSDEVNGNYRPRDLLGILMEGEKLTKRELVDECKTFFFGGHETTALALTWTLMVLALNPEWQDQLREEIKEVVGNNEIDFTMLARLKKMGWVMNEMMRLYSPAPNAQRQTREDIQVDDQVVVPKGTNMWIDMVGMHHDKALWGEDVNEFKPERFRDDPLYGGCKHKMGFLPFGFGGRMCIGRNLTVMEYKVVLTLILSRFSLSISPNYCHSPSILLSLRPRFGLPLMVQPL